MPQNTRRADGTLREVEEARLIWQTHPQHFDVLNDLLAWAASQAPGARKTLTVQSADPHARPIVEAAGYTFDAEDDGWTQFNARPLTDIPSPELPEGYRFLTAEEVSTADAAQAHRDAWHSSTFTEAACARVQGTWPYRPDLHLFVAAPGGRLLATAIIWFDPVSRTAEFEPVGTHRDHRRQGLGTALQLHGMSAARSAGAEVMLVACEGAETRPAARQMYYGVGFKKLSRDLSYSKEGA